MFELFIQGGVEGWQLIQKLRKYNKQLKQRYFSIKNSEIKFLKQQVLDLQCMNRDLVDKSYKIKDTALMFKNYLDKKIQVYCPSSNNNPHIIYVSIKPIYTSYNEILNYQLLFQHEELPIYSSLIVDRYFCEVPYNKKEFEVKLQDLTKNAMLVNLDAYEQSSEQLPNKNNPHNLKLNEYYCIRYAWNKLDKWEFGKIIRITDMGYPVIECRDFTGIVTVSYDIKDLKNNIIHISKHNPERFNKPSKFNAKLGKQYPQPKNGAINLSKMDIDEIYKSIENSRKLRKSLE